MAQLLLAVDPGDVHTGVSEWIEGTHQGPYTLGREEAEDHLAEVLADGRGDSVLVIEEFRLYPWLAEEQTWSDFQTSQLIGALKYIGRINGAHIVMQETPIKKPTFARLRHKGIPLLGQNQHEQDAEAHGWHWLLTQGGLG